MQQSRQSPHHYVVSAVDVVGGRTVELRVVVDGAHDLGKGLAVRILEDLPDQRQDERRHDDWDCGISGLDRQSDEQYDM